MKRLHSKRSLALGCALAIFAVAAAPRGAWAADATSAKEDTSVAAKEEGKAFSAVNNWGLRGGATLREGIALRAQFSAGTAQNINNGYLNAELGMLFAVGQHFDIGFNLRVPAFQLGVSPGIALRAELIDDGQFHMSLVGNLQVPMILYPGFWIGLSVEPGLMVSYFFSERTELYSGLLFVWSPLFQNPWVAGTGHMGFAGIFRVGLAYTLGASNIGFYTNIDAGMGYEPLRRFILIGDRGSGLAFNVSLTVGSQFKF
jgi:hypothetical protein